MLISIILAWMTVVFTVLAAVKYIARISGLRGLNRFFSKCHIPFGWLMLSCGLVHGLLAGNPSGATLADLQLAPVLFTLNWGSAALGLGVLLALSYLLRKKLKKHWMPVHRLLTVLLLAVIVLHVVNTGVTIFDALSPDSASSAAEETVTQTDDPLSSVSFSGAQLADGSYEGTASGYKGDITVSVTVSGGKVTDIAVVSQSDTPQFFSQAQSVLTEITDSQSLDVDAVSGATYSSSGLINAVADALQGAVTSGSLTVSQSAQSNSSGGMEQHGGHGGHGK